METERAEQVRGVRCGGGSLCSELNGLTLHGSEWRHDITSVGLLLVNSLYGAGR